MTIVDFSNIRPEGGSQADGFEEFCAQTFHYLEGLPTSAVFERFRGAGGDGGAEAIWRLPDGTVWAMQSKLFPGVRNGDQSKYHDSFKRALNNYPGLKRYFICVPFDPSPTVKEKTGKVGGAEKLKTWTTKLVGLSFATVGYEVEIIWWFSSALKSRLLNLENAAGRIRYWFDAAMLDTPTISTQIAAAERLAGRRYSPVLRVGTDADLFLGALGKTGDWLTRTQELSKSVTYAMGSWRRVSNTGLHTKVDSVTSCLKDIGNALATATDGRFEESARTAIELSARAALATRAEIEHALKAEFDVEHGADSDTPGFRQFSAEYMVSFPAADLDQSCKLKPVLEACVEFADGWDGRASTTNAMVMRGPAGIGKTHAAVDAAKRRLANGALSIVVFGEEIDIGQDPWRVLAAKLGLSPDVPRPELVGAVEAAAEASGWPIVIFIDALNETQDRRRWQSWLPDLLAMLAGPTIKLCLACRDLYLDEVLGHLREQLLEYTHNGFAGREHEAANSFADFYGLEQPANVIAQPEFANPLFLHLVCRAIKGRGDRIIPAGAIDLGWLVDVILTETNRRAARHLGYDQRDQNVIRDGIMALGRQMAADRTRSLPLAVVRQILNGVWQHSASHDRSLLHALEAEDLIVVVDLPSGWSVLFGFDRLGDLLVARSLLEDLSSAAVRQAFNSGSLHAYVADESAIAENAGLLQALSIVLPETHDIELIDLVADKSLKKTVVKLMLDSLSWRSKQSIKNDKWLWAEVRSLGDAAQVIEKLLTVATVPDHFLNAIYLHEYFSDRSMVNRDPLLGLALGQSWDEEGHACRLVKLARSQDLAAMSADAAMLLGVTLGWFCSAADRRIRDHATKALSRLMVRRSDVAAPLFERFKYCDDEYVIERLLAASYAATLAVDEPDRISSMAKLAYRLVFYHDPVPANALVRDTARLIIEHAVQKGCDMGAIDLVRARPPYQSTWPLTVGDDDWKALRDRHPDFLNNMFFGESIGTDFARYVVDPILGRFDLVSSGLSRDSVLRWLFEQTLAFGYPGTQEFALSYDSVLVGRYGPGRSKPIYAERLGKKYSWIALAQLAGILSDNCARKSDPWDKPQTVSGLQGIDLRSIDPTDFNDGDDSLTSVIEPNALWTSTDEDGLSDDLWVAAKTFPAFQPLCDDWVVLSATASKRYALHQSGAAAAEKDDHYRRWNGYAEAFLVKSTDRPKLSRALKREQPSLELPRLYDIFIGEYPASVAYHQLTRSEIVEAPFDKLTARHCALSVNRKHEYDCSVSEREPLLVPAPELISFGGLIWDGVDGWLNAEGHCVALQVSSGSACALIIEKRLLEHYLSESSLEVVWITGQSKMVVLGFSRDGGLSDQQAAYVISGNSVKRIWRQTQD